MSIAIVADRIEQGHAVTRPALHAAPLVVASPHSGRLYPASLVEASRLRLDALRRSEDCLVDALLGAVPTLGVPLIQGLVARVHVDLNREPYELDPAMFDQPLPDHVNGHSPRVVAGIGTIARLSVGGDPIYARPLAWAEAEQRIEGIHRPYHAALLALIEETRRRFGRSLLVDVHSMPSAPMSEGGPIEADIILGDCYGQSCNSATTARIEGWLGDRGYRVLRNQPYAGGYTTRHYGRPAERMEAIQIELNRALYLDEARFCLHGGAERLRRDLTGLFAWLAGHQPAALAAE